jgi:hypothetical protein
MSETCMVGGLIEIADCRSVGCMLIDPVPIKALQNMLAEIETLISTTTPLPENRTTRCLELLQTARALTNDILKRASRVH